MLSLLDILSAEFQKRLKKNGVPLVPASRTADQVKVAALTFWAVVTEACAIKSITQAALERS